MALDWAVAKIEGVAPQGFRDMEPLKFWTDFFCYVSYSPSSRWDISGPIIEREGIAIDPYFNLDGAWSANTKAHVAYGPTPLIAAMRCYVKSCLGDEIDVPDVLA